MVRGLEGAPGTASVFAWLEWLRRFRFYKCGVLSCSCPAPRTWNTWREILPPLKLMGILPWVWFLSAHTIWYKERQIPPQERGRGKKRRQRKKSISATLLVDMRQGWGDRAGVPYRWGPRQAQGLLSWTETGSRAERAGKPSTQREGDEVGELAGEQKSKLN